MLEYLSYSDNQITYIISELSQKCCLSTKACQQPTFIILCLYYLIIYLAWTSMLCQIHNKPFHYLALNQKGERHLKCKDCNIEGKFISIDIQIQRIKENVNRNRFEKREQRVNSKIDIKYRDANSKGKIVQQVAQQQLVTLETLMRLFAEEKKKIYERIQKVKQEKITNKSYLLQNQSLREAALFYRKILDKRLIEPYSLSLSRKGWQKIKNFLRQASIQTFLLEKETIQLNRSKEKLKVQISIDGQTLLNMVQKFVQNEEKSSKRTERTETTNVSIQSKYPPILFRQNNLKIYRRSNSFT